MGIVLIYDCTDPVSFKDISNWLKQIEHHANTNVSKLLVCSKCDLTSDRKITEQEGSQLAAAHNLLYFETSAKTGKYVCEMFECMARDILKKGIHLGLERNMNVAKEKKQRIEFRNSEIEGKSSIKNDKNKVHLKEIMR